MFLVRIAKTLLSVPHALVKSPLSLSYTAAKLASARFDYEVSLVVDRFRRAQMQSQRFTQVERDLQAKIDSFHDLIQSASSAEKAQLQKQTMQLEWVLAQVRGEANGSAVTTAPAPRQSSLDVLSSILAPRRNDLAAITRMDVPKPAMSRVEEIPIE